MSNSKFINQWLRHFASDVPEKDLRQHVLGRGNYIWHIFSWKLLPEGSYLVGNAAREAYDQVDKTDAVYYEPFQGGEARPVTEAQSCAALLDTRKTYTEIYIVGKDFSWTYIKTHEDDLCGPYFYQKQTHTS